MRRRGLTSLDGPVLRSVGWALLALGVLAAGLALAQGGAPGYAALKLIMLGGAVLVIGRLRRGRSGKSAGPRK